MLDPLRTFIDRLAAGGWDPIATGQDSWESRCPGHNGQGKRNLSITTGEGGRVLVNCHCVPKCPPEVIAATLGLTMADLFADSPARNGQARVDGKAERGTKESTVDWFIEKVLKLDLATTHSTYWPYRSADGQEIFYVVRIDPGNGAKKTYRPVSRGPRGWVLKDPAGLGKLPLYNLPDLAKAETVYVPEGEKCSGKVKLIGLVGTTSSHGAEAPHKTDWTPLAGKQVVILPDNDEDGECYAKSVCGILATLNPPPITRVVRLKDFWGDGLPLPDGGDVADWLTSGMHPDWGSGQWRAELERVASATEPEKLKDPAKEKGRGEKKEKKSQAEIILDLVEGAAIFRDKFKTSYISVKMHSYDEIYEVESKDFKNFLINLYMEVHDKPPSQNALGMAISAIDAKGWAKRDEDRINIRVAGDDSLICIDLQDGERQIVEITPGGWEVVPCPRFRFCRPKGMAPLAVPQRGGSIDLFRPFVNCSDDEFVLLVAWIAAALRPEGPYPVLALVGEHGSAKSTLTKMLRVLIDPNFNPIRAEPRDARELMITAAHSAIIAYENITSITSWMSDGFCRIATGAGYTARSLYTNADEYHFYAQRPIVINGITDYVTRPDLVDRSLFLHLHGIDDKDRKAEREIWPRFNAAVPMILGALYDAVAGAMVVLPAIRVSGLSRMADFALWGEAVSQTLGWELGKFSTLYGSNREEADEVLVDDSAIADRIRHLVRGKDRLSPWSGTVTELLDQLNSTFTSVHERPRDWPGTIHALSSAIKRFKTPLKTVGVVIEDGKRTSRKRILNIWTDHTVSDSDDSSDSTFLDW
jgi:putative DNA primase/helicase